MIVLKHLAREFNMDPHRLRMILRPKFTPTNRRWKWPDDDPQLQLIRDFLRSRKRGSSTSTSQGSSSRSPSATTDRSTHSSSGSGAPMAAATSQPPKATKPPKPR